jgi:hypothetical protein
VSELVVAIVIKSVFVSGLVLVLVDLLERAP